MSDTNNKSWLEHLRVVTPIMVFTLGVYVNMVNNNITDVKNNVNTIQAELFHHLTNSELHVPRATVISKDEFSIYQAMRDRQMTDIKDGLGRVESLIIQHMGVKK